MAWWHHWLDERESGWTPGVGDGQGGLACCDSWGRKESDMTERLNWLNWHIRKHKYLIKAIMKDATFILIRELQIKATKIHFTTIRFSDYKIWQYARLKNIKILGEWNLVLPVCKTWKIVHVYMLCPAVRLVDTLKKCLHNILWVKNNHNSNIHVSKNWNYTNIPQ